MLDRREIIINENNVYVIRKEIESRISVEDFALGITKRNMYFETKQLPVNCVKYETKHDFDRYYIHIPEDNYKLNYNGKLYVVRLPHTVIIFKFQKDSVRLNKSPIMLWTDDKELDLESENFFVPLLHNVYDNGNICEGQSVRLPKDQRDYVNKYLKNLFSTEFNDDLNSGKRMISNVAKDQYEYNKHSTDKHELVGLWWKKLIHEHDVYVLSKEMFTLDKGGISRWIK